MTLHAGADADLLPMWFALGVLPPMGPAEEVGPPVAAEVDGLALEFPR